MLHIKKQKENRLRGANSESGYGGKFEETKLLLRLYHGFTIFTIYYCRMTVFKFLPGIIEHRYRESLAVIE